MTRIVKHSILQVSCFFTRIPTRTRTRIRTRTGTRTRTGKYKIQQCVHIPELFVIGNIKPICSFQTEQYQKTKARSADIQHVITERNDI